MPLCWLTSAHHTIDEYAFVVLWWRDQGLGPEAPSTAPCSQALPWQDDTTPLSMLLWNHDHDAAYRQLPLRHPQHAYLVYSSENPLGFGYLASASSTIRSYG
eukprot:2490226-Amphidinium_carterae.1